MSRERGPGNRTRAKARRKGELNAQKLGGPFSGGRIARRAQRRLATRIDEWAASTSRQGGPTAAAFHKPGVASGHV